MRRVICSHLVFVSRTIICAIAQIKSRLATRHNVSLSGPTWCLPYFRLVRPGCGVFDTKCAEKHALQADTTTLVKTLKPSDLDVFITHYFPVGGKEYSYRKQTMTADELYKYFLTLVNRCSTVCIAISC